MKDIGIKNKFNLYKTLIIAFFMIFAVLTLIWSIQVAGNYQNNKWLNIGIEVEAEIIDEFEVDEYDEVDNTYYTIICHVYQYVSPEGKMYNGTTRHANLRIGDKIKILIDTNSSDSIDDSLDYLNDNKDNNKFDLPLLCVFGSLFLISSYLFFYRVVYRNALDKKILKYYGNSYLKNGLSEGEVIKTFKWIVGYVKVRYRDEKDIAKEKWARAWFTLRETKFLEEKKYVKIIVYKRTFGILEEMPIKYKAKRSITQ